MSCHSFSVSVNNTESPVVDYLKSDQGSGAITFIEEQLTIVRKYSCDFLPLKASLREYVSLE